MCETDEHFRFAHTMEVSPNVDILVGLEKPVVRNAVVDSFDSFEVMIDVVVVFVECSDACGIVIIFKFDDTVEINRSIEF